MPTRPGRRTIAIVRYLKALGPLPSRRALPRQQQPDAIRASYYRDALPYALIGARSMNRDADEIVRLVAEERRAEAARRGEKMDVSRKDRALELVRQAAARAARELNASEKEIAAVARKHGRATSIFQREQLNKQTKAALSVPLAAVEPVVVEKLDGFAAENVDLIKTISDRYFDRIRLDVLEAFDTGMRPETMAESFVERMGMSENDAMRIARDQIGKLNGQLNMERQKGMGVTGYTWRGVRDNRERDEHVEREGEHFTWDNPPEDGHPGEPIQCRCYAEPDFDDIMAGVREESSAPTAPSRSAPGRVSMSSGLGEEDPVAPVRRAPTPAPARVVPARVEPLPPTSWTVGPAEDIAGSAVRRREWATSSFGDLDPKARERGAKAYIEIRDPDQAAGDKRMQKGGIRSVSYETRNGESHKVSRVKWHESIEEARAHIGEQFAEFKSGDRSKKPR